MIENIKYCLFVLGLLIVCCFYSFPFFDHLQRDGLLTLFSNASTPINVVKKNFTISTFENNLLKVPNFNYTGNCSEVFKYNRNNKRDLIFSAIHYKDSNKWNKEKLKATTTLSINKGGVPFCSRVLVLYGEEPEEGFITRMESLGFDVIKSNKDPNKKGFNAAIERYHDFYDYLTSHRDEYDRVAITDFRDVMWFADGFATFSKEEFIVSHECSVFFNKPMFCRDYTNCETNYKWMTKCYGKEMAHWLRKEKKKVINVGMVMGGIDQMIEFTKIFTEESERKREKHGVWGIDQSVMNVVVHTGKVNHINITFNEMTQRIGMEVYGGYVYDLEKKAVYDPITGCSPVVRHKILGAKVNVMS